MLGSKVDSWTRGNGILLDVFSSGALLAKPPIGPEESIIPNSAGNPWHVMGVADNPPSQGPGDNRIWMELGFACGIYFGRRDQGIQLHTTLAFTIIDDIGPSANPNPRGLWLVPAK